MDVLALVLVLVLVLVLALALLVILLYIAIRWVLERTTPEQRAHVRELLETVAAPAPVLATGVAAPALIVAVEQVKHTGRVSASLEVKLTLEVRPADRAPFTARLWPRIPLVQLPQVQPGRVVEVRYDPADTRRVAIASL